jgi:hypothetical protein
MTPTKPDTTDEALAVASARLARTAPEAWSDFLKAFERYSDQAAKNCVQSPPEVILVAQGRAQSCASILKAYQNCLALADKIMERRK